MGPGPFWIENRELENQKKLKSLMIIACFQKNKTNWVAGWVDVWNFFSLAMPLMFC